MRRTLLLGLAAIAVVIAVLAWRSATRNTTRAPNDESTTAGAHTQSSRVDLPRAARASISGTVRDEAKAPIAGATVCADVEDDDLPSSIRNESICATADANGAYLLPDLFATKYVIVAGARTYRPNTASVTFSAGENKLDIDVTLSSGGGEITGTVSDAGGGPIAHAKVRAHDSQTDGARSPSVDTDEQGRFAIWVRPGGVRVEASADGYVTTRASCTAPCRLELLLTPESSIAGIVVDGTTGAPVEGARIQLEPSEWVSGGERVSELTDAAGAFHARRLVSARYDVIATAERAYGRSDGSVLVRVAQAVDGVVIKVFPAARLAARIVVTGETARGCPKGGVVLRSLSSNIDLRARSDGDGNLTLDGILPGTYRVGPWCDGHATRETYPHVVIADTDSDGLIWEVDTGGTVRGRVTNNRGEPVAGVQITGRTWGGRDSYHSVEARTGTDGRYDLRGLRQGTYHLVVSSSMDLYVAMTPKVESAGDGVTEKNFVLEDAGSISGTAVDSTGAPVAGLSVEASLKDEFRSSESNNSDALGAFTIVGLHPGEYRLSARRNFAYVAIDATKVNVRVGPTVVRLVVNSPGGTIIGTVVDMDRKPIADAYVTAAREGLDDHGPEATRNAYQSEEPVLTRADGTYALKGLEDGTYMLRAYRRGEGEVIVRNVSVGSTTTLTIKRTGSIEGVAKASGASPSQMSVLAEERATRFTRAETVVRTDGRFTLRDLPAGHYLLSVESETGRASTELDLAPGETRVGVVLELVQMLSLTGRVIDLFTREPIAGMNTWATLASGGPSAHVDYRAPGRITDDAGRFTITRVSPGRLTIYAGSSSGEYVEITRTLDGTGTITLGDLMLARSRRKADEQQGELGITLSRREISSIVPNSGAAKAGLKVGDVISSIDGIDVTGDREDDVRTLLDLPVGAKVLLGVVRGVIVPVIVGPRTPP